MFTSAGNSTVEKVKWYLLPDIVQLNTVLKEHNLSTNLKSFKLVKKTILKESEVVKNTEKRMNDELKHLKLREEYTPV